MWYRTSFIFLVLVIFLSGCSLKGDIEKVKPTPIVALPPSPLPDFLYDVFPEPGTTLTLDEFANPIGDFYLDDEIGPHPVVCVEVSGDPLFDTGYDFGERPVEERTKVVVDGMERDTRIGYIRDYLQVSLRFDDKDGGLVGSGPWSWCLSAPLDVGIHRVDVSSEKISGAIVSYAWTFTLVKKN